MTNMDIMGFRGLTEKEASALRKLHEASALTPMSVGTPATASLFIVNPFGGGGVARLFSTHPPVADRIRRLDMIFPKADVDVVIKPGDRVKAGLTVVATLKKK